MTTTLADLRKLTRPLSAFAAFQLGHVLPSRDSVLIEKENRGMLKRWVTPIRFSSGWRRPPHFTPAIKPSAGKSVHRYKSQDIVAAKKLALKPRSAPGVRSALTFWQAHQQRRVSGRGEVVNASRLNTGYTPSRQVRRRWDRGP